MVSLVIVSHSAKLAEGVIELARGVSGTDVQLAAAGGLDLPEQPLGTDVSRVIHAIEEVYTPAGVLVLMDLGSAVLSAEMALEQLGPERRERVLLSEAPLVEGAVAAAVQARLGSSLAEVAAAAREAAAPKISHLADKTQTPVSLAPRLGPGYEQRFEIHNQLGLHARPAARLVQAVARFKAEVQLTNLTQARGPVNAKSINALVTLGVRKGHQILVQASGLEAKAALEAVSTLVETGFGETKEPTLAEKGKVPPDVRLDGPVAQKEWQGIPASPGIAVGPLFHFEALTPSIPERRGGAPDDEWQLLMAALEKTRLQIEETRNALVGAPAEATGILDAHLLFLQDEALRAPAQEAIFREQMNAAAAWKRAAAQVGARYRELEDEYLRARGADLDDVALQVLLNLLNGNVELRPATAGILVARDLAPSQAARVDPNLVLGICTAAGGANSHASILARARGIPAAAGLGEELLNLPQGGLLILDGSEGRVWFDPPPEQTAEYSAKAARARQALTEARRNSAAPAVTRDGYRMRVAANLGSVADAQEACSAGADEVGLVRTEFLFLNRRTPPDEGEQCAAYRTIAQTINRPVVIRTLDAGGDKILPYLDPPHESNPFLGFRAIRLCLSQPAFFQVQLRAILRVAAEHSIRLMFPMIATLEEWRAAGQMVQQARAGLQARGIAVPERIETGMMVEVPAAVMQIERFVPEVDFFSIGTNDLVQYAFAAERGNAQVASLTDAYHPVILRSVEQVVKAAHAHGKWVGVCGELAGEVLATPALLGLQVDELSMNPASIPLVKRAIRLWDLASAQVVAADVLKLDSASQVREYLRQSARG